MRKTTVYLTDEEAAGLLEIAAATGLSQAHLIRQGVRLVIQRAPARVFVSMGRGEGPGGHPRWSSDQVYRKVFGEPLDSEK